MSTRLYKINGEYNTFEYWHDHFGYTKTPTFSIQYKTTNPWGAAYASGGYYDAEDLMDIFTFSFFVPGVVGWYSIDDLALEGYYPAAATDLTVYREGVASNAASLTGDDGTYYLVERDINQGWMTEEEMFARGWEFITIDYTYLLIDETTGNSVLENFEQDFAVEPIAESIIPEDDFVVTPLTEFPVTTFYLNEEGNKATEDHYLTMTGNPVFDLNGNNILYDDYKDIQGVMPAYFSRVDNTFFMGQSGDTFVDWSDGKAGIGAVASRGKSAWSVSFERRDGVIDVYVKTNSTYPTQFRYQSKVTSTSTAAADAGSLNEIYLDSAFTQPLQVDPNMDYELGSMVNQEWTPNAIQTKEDMPSSTTSSTSTKVSAELLTESNGNFLIWFVTNYTSTSSISAPDGYAIRKLRVTPKPEIRIECNFGDTITVPSGYRVKSVKSTDAFAFGHGSYSSTTAAIEYYGENTYSSDISQTDINTSGTPGMYIFQMNRNEFPLWGNKLIPNANVTSLSNITVNQNGIFVKLSGTSSSASTIATNANTYPGLFKYQDSSGTVVPQFFNVPSSLWKFENGTFSWLGNTSSPSDLAYWYYNDAAYAGIVVTLTNEPAPLYTEYALYKDSGNVYLQTGITSSYSGQANSQSLAKMYQDSGLTQPLAYDSSKRYVRGTYTDGVWVEQEVQSVSDMPSSTVSSLDGSTRATIAVNKDGYVYLWAITNMTTGGYYVSYDGPYYIRVYDN